LVEKARENSRIIEHQKEEITSLKEDLRINKAIVDGAALVYRRFFAHRVKKLCIARRSLLRLYSKAE